MVRLPARFLFVVLLGAVLLGTLPARAQEEADAHTLYALNLRSGPGPTYAILTMLPANTALIVESRSTDASWLLVHSEDGMERGWAASLYLTYRTGFSAFRLPVSDEILAAPTPESQVSGGDDTVIPAVAGVAPILEAAPVLPTITSYAQAIFAEGQQLGNNPHVFAKVGDCNTFSPAFMGLIGRGQYSLGPYRSLQPTIDFFAGSFDVRSLATSAGYTALAVTDPAWGTCGQSPLECEYDRIHPSVALIMFGLQDVHFLNTAQYEAGMRHIIDISLERGVIPVLTTFPAWAGETDGDLYAKRLAFNTIVVQLAAEYDVPLINFWRATQELPMSGLSDDLLHISYSGTESHTDWISFGGDEQQYGFTLWNLLALQTLETLRSSVLSGSARNS